MTVDTASSTLSDTMSDDLENEFLTTEEVARILKVTPKLVRREATEGRLKGFKIGREWRFTRADVRSYRGTGT